MFTPSQQVGGNRLGCGPVTSNHNDGVAVLPPGRETMGAKDNTTEVRHGQARPQEARSQAFEG
jgi:hypothetical protein